MELPVNNAPETPRVPVELAAERLEPRPKPVRKVVLERKTEQARGVEAESAAARKAEVFTDTSRCS